MSAQAKVKLLRTGGTNNEAKEARAKLKEWVPPAVLPLSLGGAASFGTDGDCCVGVEHASFLRAGEGLFSAGGAALESFSGVAPHEIAAVRTLQRELGGGRFEQGDFLREQPVYVRSEVALLRVVQYPTPNLKRMCRILDARRALNSDAKGNELLERGLALHTLPGAERLRSASLQTNEWAGLDAQGDIIVYERWGAVIPAKLLAQLTVPQYSEWNAYRFEARAMMLDSLSRRARRVVCFAIVINMEGLGLGHRKLIPYFKEFVGGDSTKIVPPLRSMAHCVRSGKVASRIYNVADRMGFLSDRLRATTFLLVGPDPFVASADFSARFRRDALPVAVGGTLEIGTASSPSPLSLGPNCYYLSLKPRAAMCHHTL